MAELDLAVDRQERAQHAEEELLVRRAEVLGGRPVGRVRAGARAAEASHAAEAPAAPPLEAAEEEPLADPA